MSALFISYRRQDSQSAAGRLADDLKERLPETRLFRDVETIAPGEDFVDAIDQALAGCGVLLAVIGPRWLTVTDADGKRRLDNPKDYTRQEVATALKRAGVRVIPVLVDGAVMPSAEDLPDDLKPLARRNAVELTDKRWQYDVGQLASTLRQHLGLAVERTAPDSPQAPKSKWPWLAGGAAVLALALGGYLWLPDQTGPVTPPEPPAMASVPNLTGLELDHAVEALVAVGL